MIDTSRLTRRQARELAAEKLKALGEISREYWPAFYANDSEALARIGPVRDELDRDVEALLARVDYFDRPGELGYRRRFGGGNG